MNNQNYFGLFYYNSDLEESVAIPLKKITVRAHIFDSIARAEFTQTYINNTDSIQNVSYVFPIPVNACIESLTVKYKSEIIEAQIQKKEDAQAIYNEALGSGKTATLGRMSEDSKDLMIFEIGNMDPNSTLSITLSLIEKLETSSNKFWTYQVLGALKPRYNPDGYRLMEPISITSYPLLDSTDPDAYPWDIEIKIDSKSSITEFECPDYEIVKEYSNERRSLLIKIDPKKKFVPSYDFTIYFSDSEIHKPKIMLSKDGEEYCAFVSFVPENDEISYKDAFKNTLAKIAVKPKEHRFNIENVRGEYIFLLDRSGSMDGERIELACQTLKFFLRSLPKNSYFNVVSFGSDYSFFSEESLLYDQKNIDHCIKFTEKGTSMGGTDILPPLQKIFSKVMKKDLPRFVFLLTDGEITNTKQVTDLISANNTNSTVYSIGIGTSCSKELIKSTAEAGNGDFEFIENEDSKMMTNKIMGLLYKSMAKRYSSFSLKDETVSKMSMIIPSPTYLKSVTWGKSIDFFLFFKADAFEKEKLPLTFIYKNNIDNKDLKFDCMISQSDSMDDSHPLKNAVVKLAVSKLFKLDSDNSESESNKKYFTNGKFLSKDDKVGLSIKHNVLFEETSFIAVFKSENSEIKRKPINTIVPHFSSKSKKYSILSTIGSISLSRVAKKGAAPKLGMRMMTGKALNLGAAKSSASYASHGMSAPKISDPDLIELNTGFTGKIMKCAGSQATTKSVKPSSNFAKILGFFKCNEQKPDRKSEIIVGFNMNSQNSKVDSQNTKKNELELLLELIEKQKIDGSWSFDINLIKKLGFDKIKLSQSEKSLIKDKNDLAMTNWVIFGVKSVFQEFENTWKIMIMKAEAFCSNSKN